jgi:hypothetical protein
VSSKDAGSAWSGQKLLLELRFSPGQMVAAAGVDGDTPPQSALIVGFAYSSNTHHSLDRGEAATRARVVLVRFLFWSFSSTAFWNLDG